MKGKEQNVDNLILVVIHWLNFYPQIICLNLILVDQPTIIVGTYRFTG